MSLEIIPLKNNVLKEVRFNEVKIAIVDRLHQLKLLDKKHLLDPDFISYVMNIIEHLVNKKDKINKKDLIFSVLRDIFNATDEEIASIEKIMDFLLSNKAIKKASYYKIFKTCVAEWLKKK
jgi:hypothetical protein